MPHFPQKPHVFCITCCSWRFGEVDAKMICHISRAALSVIHRPYSQHSLGDRELWDHTSLGQKAHPTLHCWGPKMTALLVDYSAHA